MESNKSSLNYQHNSSQKYHRRNIYESQKGRINNLDHCMVHTFEILNLRNILKKDRKISKRVIAKRTQTHRECMIRYLYSFHNCLYKACRFVQAGSNALKDKKPHNALELLGLSFQFKSEWACRYRNLFLVLLSCRLHILKRILCKQMHRCNN